MWYIVKYNILQDSVFGLTLPPALYAGLYGDHNPLSEIDPRYNSSAMAQREYITLPDGTAVAVWKDKRVALDYYRYTEMFSNFLEEMNLEKHGYLLQMDFADENINEGWDGFDFGNIVDGSALTWELLARSGKSNDDSLIRKYLNDKLLFKSFSLMMNYVENERTEEMKTDDEYYNPVVIKIIASPLNPF